MGMICSYADTKGCSLFSYILIDSPLNFIDSSFADFINVYYNFLAYRVFCYKRFRTKANVYSLIFDESEKLKYVFKGQMGNLKFFIFINEVAIFNILKILYIYFQQYITFLFMTLNSVSNFH